MTMGEIIRYHRTKLKLSQEELGAKLGVNKAAVQKWESGKVENLKRSKIMELAHIFEISPCTLMGWDDTYDEFDKKYNKNNELENEVHLIEHIQKMYGKNAVQLLQAFSSMNDAGKKRILDNALDFAALDKYKQGEAF